MGCWDRRWAVVRPGGVHVVVEVGGRRQRQVRVTKGGCVGGSGELALHGGALESVEAGRRAGGLRRQFAGSLRAGRPERRPAESVKTRADGGDVGWSGRAQRA
ncbi:uncharacterized protein A4U43_C04F12150 [Asparagus officinalis]|uniref:Uncharacterized protein n=1 Tax=Asparagus officinalis TaxID=4686 RepID=A0A5P1F0X0_ASPOF|nr:uncharacterized protein A4U43_C04F12150 [Asparagus officinalis]